VPSCEVRGCKSRNKRAVWRVDGKLKCHSHFERWMESHSFDEHSIVRLSESEADFPEKAYPYTARMQPASA